MKYWVLILAFLGTAAYAQRDDVVEMTIELSSEKTGPMARQEMFDRAIEQASGQYIQRMIGELKAQKYATLIKNKILKQSGKYVLFIKGTQLPRSNEAQPRMQVQLKLGLKSLESLLLDEGLLYRSEGPPRILPMVSLVDRVASHAYSWWSMTGKTASSAGMESARQFNLQLRKAARPRGFFVIEPVGASLVEMMPEVFVQESLPTEDLLFFGEYLTAEIVIKGSVAVNTSADRADAYRIDIRLQAIHASNARVVGEVIRSYETESGSYAQVVPHKLTEVSEKVADDLMTQIHETWKSGTFGANAIRIGVLGDLQYQEMVQFKKLLMTNLKDVRQMRERLFSPGKVVFEVDAESNPKNLSESVSKVVFPRFKVEVDEVRADGFDLRVKAL